jgi:hypothetical protein
MISTMDSAPRIAAVMRCDSMALLRQAMYSQKIAYVAPMSKPMPVGTNWKSVMARSR